MTNERRRFSIAAGLAAWCLAALVAGAQAPPQAAPQVNDPENPASIPSGAPPDYIIGPDDVLAVVFWRDESMSAEVVVRPDGKISLPLINEISAIGLTPEELRAVVTEAAKAFMTVPPTVSVLVKQINSRKVFITGNVNKPGVYPLNGPMTVLQLISTAGGLLEYADAEHIIVVRATETRPDGSPWSYEVNYKQLTRRENLTQNILLKPGDQVIVP